MIVYEWENLISHPKADGIAVFDFSTSTESTYKLKVPPALSEHSQQIPFNRPSPATNKRPASSDSIMKERQSKKTIFSRLSPNSDINQDSDNDSRISSCSTSSPSSCSTSLSAQEAKRGAKREAILGKLNKLVMYDAMIPVLTKLEILLLHQYEEALNQSDHAFSSNGSYESSVSSSQQDDINYHDASASDKEEEDSATPVDTTLLNYMYTDHLKATSLFRQKPSSQLASEIELLNLVTKHKMPLGAFSSIMHWAKTSVQEHKCDFCSKLPVRSRKTIFRETRCQLKLNTFQETYRSHIVKWLPDDRPTLVYVKDALDAIHSLLSNKYLMRAENLSFPNQNDPTSPIRDPPVSMNSSIKELHDGSWWIDSWKQKCKEGSNEVYVPLIFYMDGIVIDQNGSLSNEILTINPKQGGKKGFTHLWRAIRPQQVQPVVPNGT